MFLVAVGFWNFLGAGVFGFLVNLPVVSYYEIGTALTANHAHAAMMGVYGMLAIGLALFCLRYLIPEERWPDKFAKLSFWCCNIGLAWMCFATLLPLGSRSCTSQSVTAYFAARQLDFISNPSNSLIEWMRLPGDVVFIVGGALPFLWICWLGVRYRVSNQVMEEPGDVLFTEIGEAVAAGAGDRSVTVSPEVMLFTGYAVFLLGRGGRPGPARAAQPRPIGPLPHGRVPLPPPARRVGVPPGPDALAGGVRRSTAPDALPRQAVGLQRLPGQGGLHQLAARPRDQPPDRAVAALRGRPVPPRHRPGARRPRGPLVDRDDAPAPSARDLAVAVMPLAASALLAHRFTDQLPPDAFRVSPADRSDGAARHTARTHHMGLRPEERTVTDLGQVILALAVLVARAGRNALVSIRVLREYQRGVVFRLDRLRPIAGPGLVSLAPFVDRLIRVDLRTVTLTIPPQEIITRDNVPARVNAVAYFRVVEPGLAITEVEAYPVATSQIAQTTLRSVFGRAELDTLLSERDELNDSLRRIIDEQTEPWGIKVTTVEIKDVEIPEAMQRAMARQPRPSENDGPRSSRLKASSRPPRSSSTRPRSSVATPPPCNCATSRPSSSSAARNPPSSSPCPST